MGAGEDDDISLFLIFFLYFFMLDGTWGNVKDDGKNETGSDCFVFFWVMCLLKRNCVASKYSILSRAWSAAKVSVVIVSSGV